MPRPCGGCEKGAPFAGDYDVGRQCRVCYLYHTDTTYRRLWDDQPAPEPERLRHPIPQRKTEPCVFLRGETGERRDCEACGGKKNVPLRGCAKHGRCTKDSHLAYREDGRTIRVPWCLTCADYKPAGEARKIVLHNPLSPGDALVMSAALECLHEQHPGAFLTAVDTPCNEIFENNPHVVPAGEGFERIRMEYPLIHQSGNRPVHFLQGYVDFLRDKLGVPLELTTNRPRLYLSEEEKGWKGRVEEILGEPAPYALVCSGTKSDYTVKGWGHENYQAVVDALQGKVRFVQVGAAEHRHRPLRGVIDQVGKTSIRELIRLAYHSQFGVGGVSFLHHVYAALGLPFACLASGMEPRGWEAYETEVVLSAHGQLPCARGCWKARVVPLGDGDGKDNSLCEHPIMGDEPLPKCMAMVKPERVVEAILGFYEGGVLA